MWVIIRKMMEHESKTMTVEYPAMAGENIKNLRIQDKDIFTHF